MSAAVKEIIEAALRLDRAERVRIAEALWESVDDAEPVENVERLWREELARRRQKIESGRARFFSIDELEARAQKALRGRFESPSPSRRPPSSSSKKLTLPVVMRGGEDDGFVVQCPLIPGCISQGQTHDEALANIREAIELCLENRESEGWDLPEQYEVVDVDVDIAA